MMASLWVSPSEGAHIDGLMSNDPETEETITDEVYALAEALSRKAEEGDFKMNIGSTYAPHSTLSTVKSDDSWSDDQPEGHEESEEDQWDDMEDVIAWLPRPLDLLREKKKKTMEQTTGC
jgi:hypothetical protein